MTMSYGPHYHSWDYSRTPGDNNNWFNYHPQLAKDLRGSSLDIVSTANNHAWDTCSTGVDDTISTLEEAGIKHFGTQKKGASPEIQKWHEITKTTVTSKDGSTNQTFVLAWVACTKEINRDREGKHKHVYQTQVMLCDSPEFYKKISYLYRSDGIDGVVAAIHSGITNSHQPDPKTQQYVMKAARSGSFLILANHAHRAQKIEEGI